MPSTCLCLYKPPTRPLLIAHVPSKCLYVPICAAIVLSTYRPRALHALYLYVPICVTYIPALYVSPTCPLLAYMCHIYAIYSSTTCPLHDSTCPLRALSRLVTHSRARKRTIPACSATISRPWSASKDHCMQGKDARHDVITSTRHASCSAATTESIMNEYVKRGYELYYD